MKKTPRSRFNASAEVKKQYRGVFFMTAQCQTGSHKHMNINTDKLEVLILPSYLGTILPAIMLALTGTFRMKTSSHDYPQSFSAVASNLWG